MVLSNAFKGTKLIETIENYSLSDELTFSSEQIFSNDDQNLVYKDDVFWSRVTTNPEEHWNKPISLIQFVVSNWVSRVPGLYWTDYSKILREDAENHIVKKSQDWIEFDPPGKSKKVLGGIGTLLFPPDEKGTRLISVSSTCNASLGIPVLIFPEVYEELKIDDGDAVNIQNAVWRPMSRTWANRFATTAKIPRGYVVIEKKEQIDVFNK